MATNEDLPVTARYDGYAKWYDDWAQTEAAGWMAAARGALSDLLPYGSGLAVDAGCGTGLHAEVPRRHGFTVLGVDYSADQLRIARQRLPVVRADARALPLASTSAQVVFSMLTHTDLERFDRLVAESMRVLEPGGVFVYVGVHPCFVGTFAERLPDALKLHPGYRVVGWQAPTPYIGDAVRRRVGVHHLALEQLFTALLHAGARLDRVIERGGDIVPEVLAVRMTRLE